MRIIGIDIYKTILSPENLQDLQNSVSDSDFFVSIADLTNQQAGDSIQFTEQYPADSFDGVSYALGSMPWTSSYFDLQNAILKIKSGKVKFNPDSKKVEINENPVNFNPDPTAQKGDTTQLGYTGFFPLITLTSLPNWLVSILNFITGYGKLSFYFWLIVSAYFGFKYYNQKKKDSITTVLFFGSLVMLYNAYRLMKAQQNTQGVQTVSKYRIT